MKQGSSRRFEMRRREILRGLATGFGLPFLSSMPSEAQAATGTKRILFVYSGNDSIDPNWWQPKASSIKHDHRQHKASAGRAPVPDKVPGITPENTFSLAAGLHPLMASLEPYRDRMLMLGRMKLYSVWGHWSDRTILVGKRAGDQEPALGPSLDQFLADKLGVESVVGFHGPKTGAGPSFRGDNQPAARREPGELFERHLGGLQMRATRCRESMPGHETRASSMAW